MGLYYQAFTGGAAGRGVAAEDILRRLRNVPVQAVIVGWSEDPALYRELGEALHRRGAELWLWFPVFSEHTLREGLRRQTGLLTGAPLGARVFDGDETFDFCCPSPVPLSDRGRGGAVWLRLRGVPRLAGGKRAAASGAG